jgi:hypothetical protein
MPSSVVASYHYNNQSETLTIKYVSGLVYDYLNVPQAEYTAMKAAFSKGTFLNESIKGKYRFVKRSPD